MRRLVVDLERIVIVERVEIEGPGHLAQRMTFAYCLRAAKPVDHRNRYRHGKVPRPPPPYDPDGTEGEGGRVEDLREFYERYIAAFNARDADAFAACFHPPVTILTPGGGGRAGAPPSSIIDDPGGMIARMPERWSYSSVDAVTALDDAAPFAVAAGLPEPRHRRRGLVSVVSRWDHQGVRYEQIHSLYLLAERDGRWGITFLTDLGFTRRPADVSTTPQARRE